MQVQNDSTGPGIYAHIRAKGKQRFDTLEEVASHYGTDLVLQDGVARIETVYVDWTAEDRALLAKAREKEDPVRVPITKRLSVFAGVLGGLASATAVAFPALLGLACAQQALGVVLPAMVGSLALTLQGCQPSPEETRQHLRQWRKEEIASELEARMQSPKVGEMGFLAPQAVLENGHVHPCLQYRSGFRTVRLPIPENLR